MHTKSWQLSWTSLGERKKIKKLASFSGARSFAQRILGGIIGITSCFRPMKAIARAIWRDGIWRLNGSCRGHYNRHMHVMRKRDREETDE